MSVLLAASKLDLKYTTARNIIKLWKTKSRFCRSVGDGDETESDNAHRSDNGAKVADFTLQRQLFKSTRRHLMISIDVPERRKFIIKIDNSSDNDSANSVSSELQDKICYNIDRVL